MRHLLFALLASLALLTTACGGGGGNPQDLVLLAEVPVESQGGGALIEDHLRFEFGGTYEGPDDDAGLFKGITLEDGDAGRELEANAQNDADFQRVVAVLTNGQVDNVTYRFGGVTNGSVGSDEPNLIESVQGPGGTDLADFEIELVTFEVTKLDIDTPGRDLNGNGTWTDHDVEGVVRIWGRRR